MKRTTISSVNKEIKHLGFELFKGNGYFYFCGLTDDAPYLRDESVYVNRLSAFSTEEWVEMIKEKINGGY